MSNDLDTRQRLEAIVSSTAEMVREPTQFYADAQLANAQRGLAVSASARSLAQGNVGAALLLAGLTTVDATYRRSTFEHLGLALREPGHDLSLYGGWAGLYAVMLYASEAGKYYGDAIAGVGKKLRTAAAMRYCDVTVTTVSDFDVISGAAGIALALRADTPKEILELLAKLAMSVDSWKVPMPGAEFLGPVHNLGVAHGIAGVLAALCWATPASEFRSAKTSVVNFLMDAAVVVDGAPAWPSAQCPSGPLPSLWHWCYGTTGVSSVLALAADHLGIEDCGRAAERAFGAVATRVLHAASARAALGLPDYGVCHGLAGLTLLLDRFERRRPSKVLAAAVARCTAELIQTHDIAVRFGYRAANVPYESVDDNGFLTGSVGIALVLGTLQGIVNDRWLSVLGVSPAGGIPPPVSCLRLS